MENRLTELSFTTEEQEELEFKLWKLVREEALRILGDDSTSMSLERAERLKGSILFTLQTAFREGVSKKELLQGDWHHLMALGQELLEEKKEKTEKEWEMLRKSMPTVTNFFFDDTMRNLGTFFGHYDCCVQAQEIPACIDYWPLVPMENLLGIDYVSEYIRRLRIECAFVNCFDSDQVKELYSRRFPAYREDFFNLCEPVLEASVCRALLGKADLNPEISGEEQREIAKKLRLLDKEQMEKTLRTAVERTALLTGMPEHAAYFTKGMAGFLERLRETAD